MKITSLFSGAGGFDLGFVNAGHKIVFAIDNNIRCCKTYEANIQPIIEAPIQDIDWLPHCDVIIGGPPCQGFSHANRRWDVDKEVSNNLILQFARLVIITQPKYFLMENVRGLLHTTVVLATFTQQLIRAGYAMAIRILDAADYGVPQHRKRVFIYGAVDGVKIPCPPTPTHSYGLFGAPYVTVNAALGWTETKILSHNRCSPGGKSEKYYSSDRPARCITTRGHCIINPRRMLTTREEATLQSFPPNFEFIGNITEQRKQIGNAMPPLMAQHIASMF